MAASEGKGSVLVVDDDAIIRRSLGRLLRAAGHRALLAEDGPAGLAMIEDEAVEVDVVILDLKMPEMSGAEVLEQLRATAARDLPVIVYSGALGQEEAPASADIVLTKPARSADILEAVARALGGTDG